MGNRVITAREKFYDKFGYVGSVEFLFESYDKAYQYYRDHHFTVEPKFRGAKKTYTPTPSSSVNRCIVNFFDVPVES
jgi:hypothetical protein